MSDVLIHLFVANTCASVHCDESLGVLDDCLASRRPTFGVLDYAVIT